MNKILVCYEADRKIAYINNGVTIRRIEVNQLNDVLKSVGIISYEEGIRKGIIQEVSNNDLQLKKMRELYIEQQLNGYFLANLDDPISHDDICQEMFEHLMKSHSHRLDMSVFRLKKDTLNVYTPINDVYKNEARILSSLLNNLDYAKMMRIFNNLSESGMQVLINHANDIDFLEKVLTALIFVEKQRILRLQEDDLVITPAMERKKYSSKYPELYLFDDKDIKKLKSLYIKFLNFEMEHLGRDEKTTPENMSRIYLNNHNTPLLAQFLEYYIKECINNGISYDMKGIYDNVEKIDCNDATILYSKNEDLKLRIRIIEKILLDYPELRKSFMQPIYSSARFGTGFYTISLVETLKKDSSSETHRMYIDNLTRIAYFCMLSNVLVSNRIISSKDEIWNLANSLCNFKNLSILINSNSSKALTFNGENLEKQVHKLEVYTKNPIVIQEMRKLGYKVFRDYMYKIHALCQEIPLDKNINLSVNRQMLEFFKEKVLIKQDKTLNELISTFAQGKTTATPKKSTSASTTTKKTLLDEPRDYKTKLISLCNEIGRIYKEILMSNNNKLALIIIDKYHKLVIELHNIIKKKDAKKITYDEFTKIFDLLVRIKTNIKKAHSNFIWLMKFNDEDIENYDEIEKEARRLR